MVPYVVGEFLGCDIAMDEDEILNGVLQGDNIANDDGLEAYDSPIAQIAPELAEDTHMEPVSTSNPFNTLASMDEEPIVQVIKGSPPPKRKRKKEKSLELLLTANNASGVAQGTEAIEQNQIVSHKKSTRLAAESANARSNQ